ncbi:MAG: acetoin utilization protein AcuC [Pseudomonadota bacterium]
MTEPARAVYVTSPIFRNPAFGAHHPLSHGSGAIATELCASLGWLDDAAVHVSSAASVAELRRFHHDDYIAALRGCEEAGLVSRAARERYHIGTMENPLFPGLFARAATTVGGSILAARLAFAGRTAFHPHGGTHHGRPERASGFCYFNDPVFAILAFLDLGLERVFYLDIDAHHGDGVEAAFITDPRVATLSIHEDGRWPYSGRPEDRARGPIYNFPVPRGLNDSEFRLLVEDAVVPLMRAFAPQALVITCGADGLAGDPLSTMALSNRALWEAVEKAIRQTPRAVVLGGGGYNPWTVARCWAGLWGCLSGKKLPNPLPAAGRAVLSRLTCDLIDEDEIDPCWLSTLADRPNDGPVRPEIRRLARAFDPPPRSATRI